MSYCRWSSDDYQCDIYCYESEDGYVIHVAGNRWVPTEPLPPLIEGIAENFEAWYARHQTIMGMVEKADRKPIGLACDGENFGFDTAGECAAKLVELKAMGYNVPDYAIRSLEEE